MNNPTKNPSVNRLDATRAASEFSITRAQHSKIGPSLGTIAFLALSSVGLGQSYNIPIRSVDPLGQNFEPYRLQSGQSLQPDVTRPGRPSAGSNYLVGGQITFISQALMPFHSPYSGANSFRSPSTLGADITDTYTLFLGWRPVQNLEFYVDPEMARGAGVGGAVGLAGFPNGDVLRVPGAGIGSLPQSPYLARYLAKWTVATGSGMTDMAAGQNQIPEKLPCDRLVFTAGKMSVTDIFDTNSYANNTRTQFMNWALINNAAYDYAADTRGYSDGGVIEWIHPGWALRAGAFEMPVIPNGPVLATHFWQDQGDQIEGDFYPKLIQDRENATVRLIAYRNVAHMGDYSQAILAAAGSGQPPNITASERDNAVKFGFLLNMEQPLADHGDTGAFLRIGWDNGTTESFAYTEADDHVSFGAQVSGVHWKMPDDRVGLAFVSDGLSPSHREYLAAGGLGFLLGDGKLNYGREMIVEAYYTHKIGKGTSLTLDGQFIDNPGYNRDRGPVPVVSVRLHWEI